MKKIVCYCYLSHSILGIFLLLSCASKTREEAPLNNTSFLGSIKKIILPNSSLSLTVPEYLDWIKEQNGITYNRQETSELELTILYKPLALEAALGASLNGDNITSKNVKKYEEIKKGYHYFEITCLSKSNSVTHPVDKNLLLKEIQNNIFVYSNSDTIVNPIVELFPSSIQSQPNKILLLVERKKDNGVTAGIRGESFGANDIRIDISKQQLDSFPKIKI